MVVHGLRVGLRGGLACGVVHGVVGCVTKVGFWRLASVALGGCADIAFRLHYTCRTHCNQSHIAPLSISPPAPFAPDHGRPHEHPPSAYIAVVFFDPTASVAPRCPFGPSVVVPPTPRTTAHYQPKNAHTRYPSPARLNRWRSFSFDTHMRLWISKGVTARLSECHEALTLTQCSRT